MLRPALAASLALLPAATLAQDGPRFAFTLGVSTLIDVAVFFWFTKPMMTLLATRKFFNSGHRLSGLSRETLGVVDLPGSARLAGGGA